MKKYKINKTKKARISEKEILKYKNFNRLSHAYQKMTKRPRIPLYKNPKAFLVLVIIALLAWVLAEISDQQKEKEEKERQGIEQNR